MLANQTNMFASSIFSSPFAHINPRKRKMKWEVQYNYLKTDNDSPSSKKFKHHEENDKDLANR